MTDKEQADFNRIFKDDSEEALSPLSRVMRLAKETGWMAACELKNDEIEKIKVALKETTYGLMLIYAVTCPGWATDETPKHMIGNILSRLNESKEQDDEAIRKAGDIWLKDHCALAYTREDVWKNACKWMGGK